MSGNIKKITKKYHLDADRRNLHFLIPTAGEIAFLFLSSKTGQRSLDRLGDIPPVGPETVDAALDYFIADVLLLSATLSGAPVFGLNDSSEREARIEEWKCEIPETIEICHRAVINYIESEY